MPETVPAISVSTQQADLPDCYAGPTTGNHTLTTDPRATPSTVEPKHDITAPGATTNEALVKGLQEVVAGQAALIKAIECSNTQNAMNGYIQAFSNSALMCTFLAALTVAMMSYLNDIHDKGSPSVMNQVLWLGSLSFEIWAITVATVSPMAMGGSLGRRPQRWMSSPVTSRAALVSVGYFLWIGAVVPLIIAWNSFLMDFASSSERERAVIWLVALVVLFPLFVFAYSWIQSYILHRVRNGDRSPTHL